MRRETRWRDYLGERPHHSNRAWQYGKRLSLMIYRLTAKFPSDERFELVLQLRRASVSVPSNIAEGAARSTTRDYLRFLYMARGSLEEIDTQLEIADELGYLQSSDLGPVAETFEDLSRTLHGLIKSLKRRT